MSCPIADCPDCVYFTKARGEIACEAYPDRIPVELYLTKRKGAQEECAPGFKFSPAPGKEEFK